MLRFVTISAAAAVGVMFNLGLASIARPAEFSPHHEHAWIGKHKTRSGASCCDHTDCFVLEPGNVVEKPDGYYLLEFDELVPHTDRKVSEDGRFYRCQWPNKRRRCFFAPNTGS